jgi:hypothetical protein
MERPGHIPGRLAVLFAASLLITGLCALFGLLYELGVVGWARFSLDREYTPASIWSALLLLFAAIAAARAARTRDGFARGSLAVLFAFMACDEAFGVHESLEKATGVDWQVLFAPIVALAAIAFFVVLRGIVRRDVWWALIGGAGAWTVAQLFEKLEWHGAIEQPHYRAMMLSEETLEMLGSTLFAAAFAILAVSAFRSVQRH